MLTAGWWFDMAEFFWEATEEQEGTSPDVFEAIWNGVVASSIGTVQWDSTEGAYGLRRPTTSVGGMYIAPLGNNIGDAEIYVDYRVHDNVNARIQPVFRATNFNPAQNGKWGRVINDGYNSSFGAGFMTALDYVGASETDLGVFTFPAGVNKESKNRCRFRGGVSGNTVTGKSWFAADSEPGAFQLNATAPAGQYPPPAVGGVVLANFNQYPMMIYAIGVGTNGDPAPTEPVTPSAPRRRPLIWVPY